MFRETLSTTLATYPPTEVSSAVNSVAMTDVIGVVGFALHAIHKVYSIVESIKDAPNEFKALHDDAQHLHSILQVLSRLLAEDKDILRQADVTHYPQLDALVRRAAEIKTTVDKFIDKTTTRKDDGTCEVKKLRWPLYANEAKRLSKRFRDFDASLTAAYIVAISCVLYPFLLVHDLSIATRTSVGILLSTQRGQQAHLLRQEGVLQATYTSVRLQSAAFERQDRIMAFNESRAVQTGATPIAPSDNAKGTLAHDQGSSRRIEDAVSASAFQFSLLSSIADLPDLPGLRS